MSKKTIYSPSLPPIPPRRLSYEDTENLPFGIPLPFENMPKTYEEAVNFKMSHWFVPRIDDYCLASKIGSEYAAHFAQYLKDNPEQADANLLGHIASDINFEDEADAKGYWVGFFSHLGRYILAGVKDIDVWADLDQYWEEVASRLAEDEVESEEESLATGTAS